MVIRPNSHLLPMVLGFSLMISAAASCSNSNTPGEKNFRITVRNGEPVGGVQTLEVKQGDTVVIRYGTDAMANFHIHGYDIETEVDAGRQRIEIFVAEIPGKFEIELEEFKATVALLEVQPR